MFRAMKSRLSRWGSLLLVACMVFIVLGYAQDASAVVRVSPRVHPYVAGYDLLSQYGEWVRIEPFGVVWCPSVDADWEPFYDGQWIWTTDGWAWMSYEPFGDLVYHYGYWCHDLDIGWFWVPGDVWSPARVEWYSYGDYCGWAPLPPPNVYWPDPWDQFDFNIWIVVHIDDFCDEHIGHYEIEQPRYRDVFRRDMVVKRAPSVRQVETVTQRQITAERIARRPMDIRTETITVSPRSRVERDVQTRRMVTADTEMDQGGRIAPVPEGRVVTPKNDATVKREVVAPAKRARIQRQGVAPTGGTATEWKAVTVRKSPQAQKQILQPKETPQPERQIMAPRQNAQAERQVVAPKQNAQPERQVAAPRQNSQVERKVETPARNAGQEQQRTVEKKSDNADKTKAEKQ